MKAPEQTRWRYKGELERDRERDRETETDRDRQRQSPPDGQHSDTATGTRKEAKFRGAIFKSLLLIGVDRSAAFWARPPQSLRTQAETCRVLHA